MEMNYAWKITGYHLRYRFYRRSVCFNVKVINILQQPPKPWATKCKESPRKTLPGSFVKQIGRSPESIVSS
jgi:hypothetical protein